VDHGFVNPTATQLSRVDSLISQGQTSSWGESSASLALSLCLSELSCTTAIPDPCTLSLFFDMAPSERACAECDCLCSSSSSVGKGLQHFRTVIVFKTTSRCPYYVLYCSAIPTGHFMLDPCAAI